MNIINTGKNILVTDDGIDESLFEIGNVFLFSFDDNGEEDSYEFIGWDEHSTQILMFRPLTEKARKNAGEIYDENYDVMYYEHDGMIDGPFRVIKSDGTIFVHEDPWGK